MRHRVQCPVCETDIIPCPFVGKTVVQCEECDSYVVLVLEGPSFESGSIRVAPWMNGRRPGTHDPMLWSVN